MSLPRIFFIAIVASASVASARQAPHPAVCRIVVDERCGNALGSGTLIDARGGFGLVVTNWHVVRDAVGTIETIFPNGFRSAARPVKLDETWDLAALVIWRPPVAPVALADTPPRPGDPLTICGYGAGRYRAATGRCTDYYAPEIGAPHEMVELSVEARQGDSGGPILNARGQLAGVLFGAGRGTTLGSFQGRVKSFLASVTPKASDGLQIAQAGPRARLGAPEIASPIANAPAPKAPIAKAEALPAPPSAVHPIERIASAADAGSAKWFKPSAQREERPMPVIASPIDGVDWMADGQTALALVGVAAIVAALFRSGS